MRSEHEATTAADLAAAGLRAMRAAAGISQADVARSMGRSPRVVRRIESGDRPMSRSEVAGACSAARWSTGDWLALLAVLEPLVAAGVVGGKG